MYFRFLPNLDYPSLLRDRSSSGDRIEVKNFFRRAKLREDLSRNFLIFEKFKIEGDDRPDNVANKYYGDSQLDWVVLLSNNIINVRDEWPMSESDFNYYLNQKYAPEQLVSIHHYETLEVRDFENNLVLPAGQIVDESFKLTYTKGIGATEYETVTSSPIISKTYFQWESDNNDAKRNINLIKSEFLPTVIEDLKRVMQYGRSSQYVSRFLKRTENINIVNK